MEKRPPPSWANPALRARRVTTGLAWHRPQPSPSHPQSRSIPTPDRFLSPILATIACSVSIPPPPSPTGPLRRPSSGSRTSRSPPLPSPKAAFQRFGRSAAMMRAVSGCSTIAASSVSMRPPPSPMEPTRMACSVRPTSRQWLRTRARADSAPRIRFFSASPVPCGFPAPI